MADVTLSISTDATEWVYSQEADEDRLLPALFRPTMRSTGLRK